MFTARYGLCLIHTDLSPQAAQYNVAASVYTISDSAAAATRSVILEADMHKSARWLKEYPIRLKMRCLALGHSDAFHFARLIQP